MMKNIQGVVMPKAMTILTLEKAQLASTKPWRWVVCTTLLFTARTTSLMAVFGVTEYVRPMSLSFFRVRIMSRLSLP